jgi:hypothetical protein
VRTRSLALVVAAVVAGAALATARFRKPAEEPAREDHGFEVEPVPGESRLTVRHHEFDGSWTFWLPEYGYKLAGAPEFEKLDHVEWQADGKTAWRFTWNVDDAKKRATGLDFAGRVDVFPDHLDVELRATNAGATPWETDGSRLALFCFRGTDQQRFRDYFGERMLVRKKGAFVKASDLIAGKFEAHRMWSLPVGGGVSRLAARVTGDGDWVLGMATDVASHLSFNFNDDVACIHSNPAWPALAPGESVTRHARVYIVHGKPEDLWARYERDGGHE